MSIKIGELPGSLSKAKEELQEIETKKRDVLKMYQKRVEGKFDPFIDGKKNEIATISKSITDFYAKKGTFNVQDIVEIICQLVNYKEPNKYEFRHAVVKKEGWHDDCWSIIKEYEGLVIAQSECFIKEESKINIYNSEEDFPGIIVLSSNPNSKTVELAEAQVNEDEIRVFIKIQFGLGFDYVYNFISKLIRYKLEKEKNDISYGEMEHLMNKFIEEQAIIEPKKEKEHQLSKKRYI